MYILGLDPADSVWLVHPNRLRPFDAVHVEAIHTDPEFGIHAQVADADFFANVGKSQPGCHTSLCSHFRSYQYFATTVSYNLLVGRECSNMSSMAQNACLGELLIMSNDDINTQE